MKKCPYCAEQIQEEAVKCKHCGEWLKTSIVESSEEHFNDDMATINNRILCSDESCIGTINSDGICAECGRTPDEIQKGVASKNNEIIGVKALAKKPAKYGFGWVEKYGWGWILFLLILQISTSEIGLFFYTMPNTMLIIWSILPFLFLIPYFTLRKRFLKKWGFPDPKPWKAGLAAGFCTYLLAIIVLGSMFFLDARSLNATMSALQGKYKARVEAFKQEEKSYRSRFISEPQTKRDIEQNMKTIDEIVAYKKEKQRFFHEMFNEYKQTLKNRGTNQGENSWSNKIDQILAAYDKTYETQLKAWALMKKYYVTGEEKYYHDYTTTYQTAAHLEVELLGLLNKTFGITANK